jgi:hypothetical protein
MSSSVICSNSNRRKLILCSNSNEGYDQGGYDQGGYDQNQGGGGFDNGFLPPV